MSPSEPQLQNNPSPGPNPILVMRPLRTLNFTTKTARVVLDILECLQKIKTNDFIGIREYYLHKNAFDYIFLHYAKTPDSLSVTCK